MVIPEVPGPHPNEQLLLYRGYFSSVDLLGWPVAFNFGISAVVDGGILEIWPIDVNQPTFCEELMLEELIAVRYCVIFRVRYAHMEKCS